MKKIIYAILIVLFVPFFNSCTKKSANDPLISLKTRNGRITGEWKLISFDRVSTSTSIVSGTTTTSTFTSTFDGTSVINVYSNNDSDTSTFAFTVSINNDGTYTNTTTDSFNDVEVITGEWWWLNNNRRKTRIAFDDDYDSWNIDKLGNKTLIVVDDTNEETTDADGDVNSYVVTNTMTFEKQ